MCMIFICIIIQERDGRQELLIWTKIYLVRYSFMEDLLHKSYRISSIQGSHLPLFPWKTLGSNYWFYNENKNKSEFENKFFKFFSSKFVFSSNNFFSPFLQIENEPCIFIMTQSSHWLLQSIFWSINLVGNPLCQT